MGKLTDKVAKGVFWVMLEKCGVQAVHFAVTLVLARLLMPSDYGTVALLSVFISISDILLDCGICSGLVRKKDATQVDYCTVFYLNFGLSIFFYGVLFAVAPLVARFYGMPELTALMRVLAVKVILQGLNDIQNVEIKRTLRFKLGFRVSWVQAVTSAAIGIALAFCGYGPWALVWSAVGGGFVGMLMLQLVVRWRPRLLFSWESARELFGFGWKLAVARALTALNGHIVSLCVGKVYARADLAFMNKGSHLGNVFIGVVQQGLGKSAFPALARIQDDPGRMRNAMRRMIQMSTFLVLPILVLMAVLAEPLILMLYGERWLPAVPFLRFACLALSFRPFDTLNFQALNARGRSDLYLKLMVFRRIVGLVVLVSTIRLGVLVFVGTASVVFGPLIVAVNAWPNKKALGYSILMQFKDVLPAAGMSVLAAGVAAALFLLPVRPLILLPIQAFVGLASYLCFALAIRYSPLKEIARVVSPILARKCPILVPLLERIGEWGSR